MTTTTKKISELFPDLCAFFMGIGLAWFFDWQTKDLVWSLWLGSLTIGYLTILSTISAGVYLSYKLPGYTFGSSREKTAANKKTNLVLSIFGGLSLLVFFTFHFGGFHAVHAVFLNLFFPLDGSTGPSMNSPDNLGAEVITKVLPQYGLFLLPVLIAERKNVFAGFIRAEEHIKNSIANTDSSIEEHQQAKQPLANLLSAPYKNVVRMHLLIFVFAFSQVLHIHTFWIFGLVYFVYFFPWREVWQLVFTSATTDPLSL